MPSQLDSIPGRDEADAARRTIVCTGTPRKASVANARLEEVLALHFDERKGSKFWLERRRELGFDPRREIRDVSELPRLGEFDRRWLLERPLYDFIPRAIHETQRTELILAETGGTTGRPVRAVFTPEEFVEAFGTPFTTVSTSRGFPFGGTWLFLGPSGPHVIGQAARLLARLHGSLEPFSVDLDPRHARAQEPGSLGEKLYRAHVVDQALDVLAREPIDVLFATPPVALALADALDAERRVAILGIHLGGMAVDPAQRARLREAFPSASILPAYGNALFGILPEPKEPDWRAGETGIDYYPLDSRLHVDVAAQENDSVDITRSVKAGESGRVVLSRIDRSFFLPNVVERDVATKIVASDALRERGFGPTGLRNPRPFVAAQANRGLY